jgi:hypothetical protein
MEQQANIRSILAANNIKYMISTVNTNGGSRSKTGSFGLNSAYTYEYYIYVHKNDYEKARYLIANTSR